MKVRLYKNKKLIENTPRPMGLQEPLMYAFSAKTADYAFAEGEEIPSEINSEYVMMETEVDDAELNKTYSDAKAEGYQGDITAVAKLMAMGIPLNMRAAVDIIPTSNIPFNTIRDSLNASGGTVNNNTWTAFLPASKINKCARYKPESYKKDFDLTENERAANYFGLIVPRTADIDTASQLITYKLPYGGSSSPYRLGDFRGYKKDAIIPFTIMFPPKIIIGGNSRISFLSHTVDNYNIKVRDIYTGTNLYFGVCVKNAREMFFKTASDALNETSSVIFFQDCPMINDSNKNTQVQVIGFITNKVIPDWTSQAIQTFQSLEMGNDYSKRNIIIEDVEPDKYDFVINGMDIVDVTKIRKMEEASYNGANNVISQDINVFAKMQSKYRLSSVTLAAYKMPANTLLKSQTVSTTSAGPSEFNTSDIIPPYDSQLTCSRTFYISDAESGVDRLNNEYVNYKVTLNYTKF